MYYDDQPPNKPADTRRPLGFPFDDFAREESEPTSGTDLPDAGDYEEERRFSRSAEILRAAGARLAWLGLAVLLAFGSAGIVAATGRSPSGGGRPELTYAADQELTARLDAAVRDLARLNDDVLYLGQLARDVLSDLSQLNKSRLSSDYQDGDATVAKIEVGAADLKASLACEPWPDSRDDLLARTYSRSLIDRWHQVCQAMDSVKPLTDDWAAMVDGAQVVIQVTSDISNHDDTAAIALQLATQGRYPEALTQLDTALTSLSDADRIAALMAKTGDVSTLTDWLNRTRTMDDALGLLWHTMIDSKGRVTPAVTAALKNVSDAKAMLPDDASILQVVIYELAGNLTSHGISIETSKGELGAALENLTGVAPSSGN